MPKRSHPPHPPRYQIVVIGEDGVGKSSLAYHYATGSWPPSGVDPTDYTSYSLDREVDGNEVQMYIEDLPERVGKSFPLCHGDYIKEYDGLMLVYSIDSRESFEELKSVPPLAQTIRGVRVPTVLVGCKADIERSREVSTQEAEDWAREIGCPFMETSTKNLINVREPFEQLVREIRHAPAPKWIHPARRQEMEQARAANRRLCLVQ